MHGISHLCTARMFDHWGGRYLWGMHIAIGSDHAGFRLKEAVRKHLLDQGHTVDDKGTYSDASTDYPGYAHAVARDVADKQAELGIVICGSGNGVNMAANKHAGIRSALAWNVEIAELARQHNNANVLALPARFIEEKLALAVVDAFLATGFGGGRHQRRVDAIDE